jgi:hypothetical protein
MSRRFGSVFSHIFFNSIYMSGFPSFYFVVVIFGSYFGV